MPIVDVTWDDAQAYCSWAGGRLPTEAEWEYAARAGSTAARYGGLDEIAWYADNSGRQHFDSEIFSKEYPGNNINEEMERYRKRLSENGNGMHEVGQKRANAFGLYDMLGNVWEWVNDWEAVDYYKDSPSQDPAGPDRTAQDCRIGRGGSWGGGPGFVRASGRNLVFNPSNVETENDYYYGFRCGGEVFAP
jgi:formylglycine-generating enzyme required for sulfatase activity